MNSTCHDEEYNRSVMAAQNINDENPVNLDNVLLTSHVHSKLQDMGVGFENIHVNDLKEDEVNGLIADLLHLSANQTESLARITHQQTNGNLFFLLQFLSVLQGDGYLQLDSSGNGTCFLNEDEIRKFCNQDKTVLDILTKKIRQLPEYEQGLLKVASCLGGTLYQSLLSETALPATSLVPALERIQETGLITFDFESGVGSFLHDRIQEAAYSLIPERDRARKHLDIGLRLWIWLKPAERDLHIFTIVNQIIHGLHLLDDDPVEQEDLARFMLRAGEKAKQLSSFSTAAVYFNIGIRLLGRRHWKHQYKLSLELYNAAAEVEYYNGNLVKVDTLLQKVFSKARKLDDKIRAYFTQIYSLGSRDEMTKALDKGLEFLNELGEALPPYPRRFQSELAWFKCKCMLRNVSDDEILSLPIMKDHRKLVIMRLLNTIWGLTISRFSLTPILVKCMIKTTLRHGLSPMCKFF
jgi:predicted ATPase